MKKKNLLFALAIPFLVLSVSSLSSCSEPERDVVLDFYNLNDFHGHLQPLDDAHPGLSAVSGVLNEQKAKNPKGYVFTNSGDMWQETYEAYATRGKAISACLKAMNCEAFGLGNHEFDWGVETILENREVLGKALPILGANVYHYDEMKKEVTTQANDIFDPYKIITRDGIDIGIIGVIGKEQITSITSSAWDGLTFVDPIPVILDYAKDLKENKGCEVVIVLSHFPYSQLGRNNAKALTDTFNETERYIDGMFLGHSHESENYEYQGVPFIQGHCYGDQISHFTLNYNTKEKVTTMLKRELIEVPFNKGYSDPVVDDVINKQFDKNFYDDANKVCGKVLNSNGTIYRKEGGNFLAYATYELIKKDYPNLVLVGNNGGRSNVKINADGTATRDMLYRTNPFTNETIIATVKGVDILNQFNSSRNCYYMPENVKIERDKSYQVAIVDYVMLHKNSSRVYDRIRSFTKADGILKTYSCEIISNYLLENKTIDYNFLRHDDHFKFIQKQ